MELMAILDHHPFAAPSGLGRVVLCPASAWWEAWFGRESRGDADVTKHGRVTHGLSLEGRYEEEASPEAAREAMRFIRWRDAEVERLTAGRPFESAAEARVIVTGQGRVRTWGRADFIAWWTDEDDRPHVAVIDLKTHRGGEIPRTMTLVQLLTYAVGAVQSLRRDGWTMSPPVMHLRAYASATGDVFALDVDPDEWVGHAAGVQEALDRRERPDPTLPLRPSREACSYCSAAGVCPAGSTAIEAAQKAVASENLADLIEAAGRVPEEQIGAALGAVRLARSVLQSAEERLRDRAIEAHRAGREIPGVWYQGRRGRRRTPKAVEYEALPDWVRFYLTEARWRRSHRPDLTAVEKAWVAARVADGATVERAKAEWNERSDQVWPRGRDTVAVMTEADR